MNDKYILCIQCGTEFAFSREEQERFAMRGFGVPKRCPECRDKKQKAFRDNGEFGDRKERKAQRHKRKSYRYDLYE